jgi:uncharacterized membrane protein
MEEQKQQEQEQQTASNVQSVEVETTTDLKDVEKNKTMAIVGYIFPILFFIPLLSDESKNSPFAKFHANQQLVLLIISVVVFTIGGIIPIIGWFLIIPIGSIVGLVLAIMGIINAVDGKMKKLPMIGSIDIIK